MDVTLPDLDMAKFLALGGLEVHHALTREATPEHLAGY
jgi:hypothetical protein